MFNAVVLIALYFAAEPQNLFSRFLALPFFASNSFKK